jgi:branched-chain amino acid transport system permease protein
VRAAAFAAERASAGTSQSERWRQGAHVLSLAGYLALTYWFAHGSLYVQGLVLVAAVFGILAISLDLVAGMTGLYSLGHAGLFALGAYTTTLLYNDHHWSLWVLLPVCIALGGAVGLVLGALSLRVSGLYFAITTFVFTLVLTVVASNSQFTGGYGGLVGPIFPDFSGGLSWLGKSLIWACMLGLLVAMLLALGIRNSPFYPVLLAVRDAEPFAAAAGTRTALVKIAMFGLSAAMAGAAGWIFSFQGIVSPGQFNWTVSVNILVMVILGGMNTTVGPVLGATFITVFPAHVNINPFWQEVLFGGLFVLVIIAFPAGFVGLLKALVRVGVERIRPAAARSRPTPRQPASAADRPAPTGIAAVEAAARESAGEAAVPSNVATLSSAEQVPAVRCREVVFGYTKGTRVLNEVDFVVERGTIHGLIGPNGSGKSTLVDLIAGRLRPQSGTIEIDGRRLERGGPPGRARSGFMRTFQSAVLVRELPTLDNVLVGLYSRVPRVALRAPVWPVLPTARRDARRMRSEALESLSFVGADAWARSRVADVPHGVEQLTQLAAACVSGPGTLVLDEPLAGLSPSEVEHAAAILAELKRSGVSVVLIEHQPRFVFTLCDSVTVLDAGEVVATGPAAEVREDKRVREVYLGQ